MQGAAVKPSKLSAGGTTVKRQKALSCGNCGGGLVIEHDEGDITLVCPKCVVIRRGKSCLKLCVAGPFTDARDIPAYKPATRPRSR